jgi:hypothetical protein
MFRDSRVNPFGGVFFDRKGVSGLFHRVTVARNESKVRRGHPAIFVNWL